MHARRRSLGVRLDETQARGYNVHTRPQVYGLISLPFHLLLRFQFSFHLLLSLLSLITMHLSSSSSWQVAALLLFAFTAEAAVAAKKKCHVTKYSAVPAAVAACKNIILDGVHVPGGQTLDLTDLQDGTTVTFAGTTTFGFQEADYDLIDVSGTDITITAKPDAIIDGNGQAWWDGQGSNGGIAKPDHFFVVDDVMGNSVIRNLYIQNYPTHCFSITGCVGLTMENIVLNNTAGNAPNSKSGGLPAAHNTDGFDVSSCNETVIRDSTVLNQDDCVAVTSGDGIIVSGMYCNGGHGLSIGSVGGKSNNNVVNIMFEDSEILNSQNGARIKTNSDTTGYVAK